MLELFNNALTVYGQYAKTNPVIAGALSLWLLGVLTYLCRKIPENVWKFVVTQSVTSVEFSNDNEWGYGVHNFNAFTKWFFQQPWAKYSRSISMDAHGYRGDVDGNGDGDEDIPDTVSLGIGFGYHFFLYRRRLFRVHRFALEKTGSNKVVSTVNITMLGRSRSTMLALIDEFRYRKPVSAPSYYMFDGEEWQFGGTLTPRKLSTVIINREIKDEILARIDEWRADRERYYDKGIAYKKTILLESKPGSGKTSLIRAIACHYNLNIAILSLEEMSSSLLPKALSKVPKNTLILMEDYDSAKATEKRTFVPDPDDPEGEDVPANHHSANFFTKLSLAAVLNSLDGIVALDDRLIFMTTNNKNASDPALLRKGRVDNIFRLGPLRHKEVLEYIDLMYPEDVAPATYIFEDIYGSDLQAIYLDNPEGFSQFLCNIPRKQSVLNQAA